MSFIINSLKRWLGMDSSSDNREGTLENPTEDETPTESSSGQAKSRRKRNVTDAPTNGNVLPDGSQADEFI